MKQEQLNLIITLPEIGAVRAAEVSSSHGGRSRLFVIPGLTIIPQGNTWFGKVATLEGDGVSTEVWVTGNGYQRGEDGIVDLSRYYVWLSCEPVFAANKLTGSN